MAAGLALQAVLGAVLSQGARLAMPGGIYLASVYAWRVDLTQVEAVADILEADSTLGLHTSVAQLRGGLQQRIAPLQQQLQQIAATLAARIDFSDEGDVEEQQHHLQAPLQAPLQALQHQLQHLLAHAETGRRLREGIVLALIGPPNAGNPACLTPYCKKNARLFLPSQVPRVTLLKKAWNGTALRYVW